MNVVHIAAQEKEIAGQTKIRICRLHTGGYRNGNPKFHNPCVFSFFEIPMKNIIAFIPVTLELIV